MSNDLTQPAMEVEPYQPDGGASLIGLMLLYGGAVVSGGVSGYILERMLGGFGCLCCVTGPIQVMVLSVILGAVGGWAVTVGKVRNPVLAGIAGLTGVAASVIGKLYAEYERVLNMQGFVLDPNLRARAAQNNLTFFDFLAELPGWQLAFIGLATVIGFGGCYAIMAHSARWPFCSICNRWRSIIRIGHLGMRPRMAVRIISQGTLTEMVNVSLTSDTSDPLLVVYVCPHCGGDSPVVVELHDIDEKIDQRKKTAVRSMGRWTYPGWAWVILERIFPKQMPSASTPHQDGSFNG